jgi:CheY-like chemotaxis protein
MTARRVLLVEDDDGIRTIAEMSLSSLGGYEVLALPSGERAVAQAAAFEPDLLVLDVSMPGMDGPQTLDALRQDPRLAATPAVFLTALTQAKEVAHYRSLGAVVDVIAKPFDPHALCNRVAAVFAERRVTVAPGVKRPAVLVVEDDPGIRYLLQFILEQQGHDVVSASDGTEGMALIAGERRADLAILDITLPSIDGLQLLEHLRTSPPWHDIPVLMLTARGDERSVQRALAAGADDYLAKPFDPVELVARLERLVRR